MGEITYPPQPIEDRDAGWPKGCPPSEVPEQEAADTPKFFKVGCAE